VGLDTHVDVFRHQHDLAIRALLLQRANHAENLVVGLADRQPFNRLNVSQRGLEVQAAGRIAIAQRGQRQPGGHLADVRHQCIQRTAHLTRIARHFRHALLVVIEFLERHHGQIDVVLLEPEQR